MKIGVLSDTHIPVSAEELPADLLKALQGADLILHAGDLVELSVLDDLRAIAPVEAVCGNMDRWDARQVLPAKRVVEAQGKRIGLIHGSGAPWSLPRRMLKEFDSVDIIVFGHSHRPLNERRKDVLLFNPGSPTDTTFAPYPSYGVLEIGDSVRAEIVRL
jgi:putative phosphoesterase